MASLTLSDGDREMREIIIIMQMTGDVFLFLKTATARWYRCATTNYSFLFTSYFAFLWLRWR